MVEIHRFTIRVEIVEIRRVLPYFSFFLLERIGLPLNMDVALWLSLAHEKELKMTCAMFR